MTGFTTFELERWQSTWENRVKWNLSESGVHPMTVRELLALAGAPADEVLDVRLGYSQSNGTDALRARIAALYPGATPDHVEVTAGSAEANFVACWRLAAPGATVAVTVPNYFQTWGMALNLGARVAEIPLREELGWQPDPEDVERAVRPGTALVVVTNPQNPTGARWSEESLALVVDRARAAGAWLLADEVYTGAERDGRITPTLWGRYEKVIAVGGLSKAYGLPGLRIGWIVAPPGLAEEFWARHDYTTIGPTGTSDRLATLALEPAVRAKILARTRGILNANLPLLETWLGRFGDRVRWTAPAAGAICWVKHRARAAGPALVETIRRAAGVLLVPGDHFGLPGYLRLGFGNERAELEHALAALGPALEKELAA